MRQRLALATALLGDPAVLVLDEPANGLDPEGIQWLRGFLRHLAHEQGRTVLVSSHLLSEVEQTVDRVVIVGAGRLVREGTIEQLRSGAEGAGTVLVRSPEAARLADVLAPTGLGVTQEDGALTVAGSTPADVGPAGLRRRRSSCTSCGPGPAASRRSTSSSPPGRSSSPRRPRHDHRSGGRPMIRLVRAEWTKLFTTRVWIGLLLGACVMVGGFAVLFTAFAGNADERPPAGRQPAVRAAGPRRTAPTPTSCSSSWASSG